MAATSPPVIPVTGSTPTPTSPDEVPVYGSSPGTSAAGGALASFVVAGFTGDAANMNATYVPDPTAVEPLYMWHMASPAEDNYMGYNLQDGKWVIFGEYEVTTAEFKAELTAQFSASPAGLSLAGINTQTGDTVTITAIPPEVIPQS